jgi:hypothetical protein
MGAGSWLLVEMRLLIRYRWLNSLDSDNGWTGFQDYQDEQDWIGALPKRLPSFGELAGIRFCGVQPFCQSCQSCNPVQCMD